MNKQEKIDQILELYTDLEKPLELAKIEYNLKKLELKEARDNYNNAMMDKRAAKQKLAQFAPFSLNELVTVELRTGSIWNPKTKIVEAIIDRIVVDLNSKLEVSYSYVLAHVKKDRTKSKRLIQRGSFFDEIQLSKEE